MELAKRFYWIDIHNNKHLPEDMDTKHLFFSLRMLWNHSAPENLKIYPYKKYRFSARWTKEYAKEAVAQLSRELSLRNDLTPYYIKCLDFMKEGE